MIVKVCGMRDATNINELAKLEPNLMGFIFYNKSPRYVGENFIMPSIPQNIQKVGVFVNEEIDEIIHQVEKHELHAVQLHGEEPVEYCLKLKIKCPTIMIIKAIGIADENDISIIHNYRNVCELLILDTKGKNYGGNGYTWDHTLLLNSEINIPFLLSGGIDETFSSKRIEDIHPACKGVDLNSKFELEPGLKNIEKIQEFIHGK